jgi:hypothetical protein
MAYLRIRVSFKIGGATKSTIVIIVGDSVIKWSSKSWTGDGVKLIAIGG